MMSKKKREYKRSAKAFFMFDYPPSKETFIFKLTDPVRIQEARDILNGKQKDKTQVTGLIVRKHVSYNPPWNYYLKPGSISFSGASIEVCDASISYVEEHLDEVGGSFLPDHQWCPWGSRLVKEVT